MTTKLNFDPACAEALAAVRNDSDPTTWAALAYKAGSQTDVEVLGQGTGDADELVAQVLADDRIVFSLVRVTEQVDDSVTTKFVCVKWIGQKSSRMLRAKQSVHSGAWFDALQPYHADLAADAAGEVSAQIIADLVGTHSGQKTKVLGDAHAAAQAQSAPLATPAPAAQPAPASEPAAKPKSVPAAKKSDQAANEKLARATLSVACDDEAAIRDALAAVRDDKQPTRWALVSYVAGRKPDTLTLVATGDGDADEMMARVDESSCFYGLSRHVEVIDASETIKFGFVRFTGAKTPRMLRARLGTHSGAIQELFAPYHVDINTEDRDDISQAILTDKIATASGKKSHVL